MLSDHLIGQTIGNYRIEARLAEGGFGSIYQGRHVIFADRPIVAIKLLHAHLASQVEYERFLQEARLLEKLKHPYILPIIDAGVEQNLPYIIAEYEPAGSLQNRIKRYAPHPLPQTEAFTIITQVGQALQYAHEAGVIHRDLKPVNILFNAKGEALLADFGIAAVSNFAKTTAVDAIGTPPYMAPEQFSNQASKRSDQYALACIAYELMTGHRPFDVASDTDWLEWMHMHIQTEPTPPTHYNSYLPPHIEEALLKALQKDRGDRFPDIASFMRALQAPAQSLPATIFAPPPPPQQPIRLGESYPANSFNGSAPSAITTAQQQQMLYVPMLRPERDTASDKAELLSPLTGSMKLLAAFSYLLFGLCGLFVLLFKPNQNRFSRYHGLQSTMACLVIMLATIASSITAKTHPNLTAIIDLLLSIPMLILLIVAQLKAFKGEMFRIPIIGQIASALSRRAPYNYQSLYFAPGGNPHTPAEVTGSEKFAAGLSYLFLFASGLLFLFFAKKSRFVRFHALQAVLFLGPLALLTLLTHNLFLPFLIAGWLIGLFQAISGRYYRMPLIGNFVARRIGSNSRLE